MHVSEATVDGQQHYDDHPFPAVRKCDAPVELSTALEWVETHRGELTKELAQSGAIFFRDFPLGSVDDFDAFVQAFAFPNFAYQESLSNAVRVNWTDRVFSANESPPEVTIYLHHEMAQTPIYPSKLFFYCDKAAEEGGATPLCRSDVLIDRMEQECPEFLRDCESKGLKYSNVMPPKDDAASGMGRSWKSTLNAETQQDAESRLTQLGYSWEWQNDGCLRATTPVLQAVRKLDDGRRSFFNQLIAAFRGWKDTRNDPSNAIRFGDDTPLDVPSVMRAVEIAEELSFDVPWQAGDVALVDNYLVMHGRRFFVGTRKVLASLVAAE
jgi:hypothetical protein